MKAHIRLIALSCLVLGALVYSANKNKLAFAANGDNRLPAVDALASFPGEHSILKSVALRSLISTVSLDSPTQPISINIDFTPGTSLDNLAKLMEQYRFSSLSIVAERYERPNSGASEVISFTSLDPNTLRQVERARCRLLVPSGSFRNNASNRKIPTGLRELPWEFSSGLAILSASQLAILANDRPAPIADMRFREVVSKSEYESITKAQLYGLSVKSAALGVTSVPPGCADFLEATPAMKRPSL